MCYRHLREETSTNLRVKRYPMTCPGVFRDSNALFFSIPKP